MFIPEAKIQLFPLNTDCKQMPTMKKDYQHCLPPNFADRVIFIFDTYWPTIETKKGNIKKEAGIFWDNQTRWSSMNMVGLCF